MSPRAADGHLPSVLEFFASLLFLASLLELGSTRTWWSLLLALGAASFAVMAVVGWPRGDAPHRGRALKSGGHPSR